MRATINSILRFWWLFVLVGIIETAGGIAAEQYASNRGKFGPVLRNATAIATGGAGEIFVYVNDWQSSEIRVFGPTGQMLRSWPVETLQGGASLAINSEELLEVFAWRGNRLFIFETDGRLVRSEVLPPSEAMKRVTAGLTLVETGPSGDVYGMPPRAIGPRGDSYEIRESEIVHSRPIGASSVIVPGPPPYLSFFFSPPFGPVAFLVHGSAVILFGLVLAHFRRSKRPGLPNHPLQPTRACGPRG